MPVIVWFRQDLRIEDNPALYKAMLSSQPILPIYIYEDSASQNPWPIGGAQKWWLHHSLISLKKSLAEKGLALIILKGNPVDLLPAILKTTHSSALYYNQCYEPFLLKQEAELKSLITKLEADITVEVFNAHLLLNPSEIKNNQGEYFKVFTPYWRRVYQYLTAHPPRRFKKLPKHLQACDFKHPSNQSVEALELLPKLDWAKEFSSVWQPGEAGAHARFARFLKNGLSHYAEGRDIPSKIYTSELSPHLHFGEISPGVIWEKLIHHQDIKNAEKFLSELVWREFSYSLLYHYQDLPIANFKSDFDRFVWQPNPSYLKAWQKGLTGYPIVDAGMRQLWITGTMHNRVRMIVASFLIKHLLIDWREGQKWFWNTLVDADLANNAASWQWVAGSGADASPYFRIFNPILQGEKFDPNGEYVKSWLPELGKLPPKYIHQPWTAPETELSKAKIYLGKNYPHPVVDHNTARKKALELYANIKKID